MSTWNDCCERCCLPRSGVLPIKISPYTSCNQSSTDWPQILPYRWKIAMGNIAVLQTNGSTSSQTWTGTMSPSPQDKDLLLWSIKAEFLQPQEKHKEEAVSNLGCFCLKNVQKNVLQGKVGIIADSRMPTWHGNQVCMKLSDTQEMLGKF